MAGAKKLLYILTGDIQIGKSRWLEKFVGDLSNEGVTSYGVISSGIWVESDSPHSNAQGFEKLGIKSILLPEMQSFEFAKRTDLAIGNGTFNPKSQAGKARLGWHISDEAVARVNAHFAEIAKACAAEDVFGLLVVDEIGRLELDHGTGLTEAVKLLEQGANDCFPDALVVARSSLANRVAERFGNAWEDVELIAPRL